MFRKVFLFLLFDRRVEKIISSLLLVGSRNKFHLLDFKTLFVDYCMKSLMFNCHEKKCVSLISNFMENQMRITYLSNNRYLIYNVTKSSSSLLKADACNAFNVCIRYKLTEHTSGAPSQS